MSETVSITVHTTDVAALTRAADMLHGLAIDAEKFPHTTITEVDAPDAPPPQSRGKAAPPATTTPTPPAGDVELDTAGVPWDKRIHSSSHKKTADGVWRNARGVDKQLVVDVTAELLAATLPGTFETLTPTPPPPATVPMRDIEPPAPPAEVKYLVNGVQYTADQLMQAGWSEADLERAEVVTAPAASATPGMTFPQLMQKIVAATTEGGITDPQVVAAVNSVGLQSLVLLSGRPDLIDGVNATLFPNG